jgi:hypothetical protein
LYTETKQFVLEKRYGNDWCFPYSFTIMLSLASDQLTQFKSKELEVVGLSGWWSFIGNQFPIFNLAETYNGLGAAKEKRISYFSKTNQFIKKYFQMNRFFNSISGVVLWSLIKFKSRCVRLQLSNLHEAKEHNSKNITTRVEIDFRHCI